MFSIFRAVFGFEQRQCVDEHRLVRNQLSSLLEFGQCRPGFDALLEHRFGFQVCRRRQRRQLVPGFISAPIGVESVMSMLSAFWNMKPAHAKQGLAAAGTVQALRIFHAQGQTRLALEAHALEFGVFERLFS